jgi:hypothetical protein
MHFRKVSHAVKGIAAAVAVIAMTAVFTADAQGQLAPTPGDPTITLKPCPEDCPHTEQRKSPECIRSNGRKYCWSYN